MLVLRPGDVAVREIQRSERRYYWSAALEVVLRKHGMIAVRTDSTARPDEGLVWLTRSTPLPEAAAAGPLVAEAPFAAGVPEALGFAFDSSSSIDQLEVHDSEGRYLGGVADPLFEVRRIPGFWRLRSDPHSYQARDLLWAPRALPLNAFRPGNGWEPLWTTRLNGQVLVIALQRQGQVAIGFPLFDQLVRLCTFPPLDEGFFKMTRYRPGLPLEQALVQLAATLVPPGAPCPRVAAWPSGFTSALCVRHDYDRMLSDRDLDDVLELHEREGTRPSWFFLVRNIRPAQLARIRERGHEIAWHANPAGPASYRSEEDEFIRLSGLRPLGMTSHGGAGSQGYLGHSQLAYAESAGHLYGELLGQSNSLPHASVSLAGGFPAPGRLVIPATHHSLDAGTRPEAHYLELLKSQIPPLIEQGHHVVLMHHPDIHRPQLAELLAALRVPGCWRASMADVAAWVRASRLLPRCLTRGNAVTIEFPEPLPEAAEIARHPADSSLVRVAAGTRRFELAAS